MKVFKVLLLLLFIHKICSYEWVQISNQTLNDQRYSQIWIPIRNFNFAPQKYGTETIFLAPVGTVTSLDFTYEFCFVMEETVKKDNPVWNNSIITDPCFKYFANDQVPYYLRGLNGTNNYTHLAVQQYCIYCNSTKNQGFTEDVGLQSIWYSTKCTNKTTDEKLCLLYYPFAPLAQFTVYYYWSFQEFKLTSDPGLDFVSFFWIKGITIFFMLAIIGDLILIAFYFIPEIIIIIRYIRKGEDSLANILYRSIFTIKNLIAILLFLCFFIYFCSGWLSWVVDDAGYYSYILIPQGTLFYISLSISLFCFTLVIIKWKQISESTNIEDEMSRSNKILLVISFLTFLVWGFILVTFWIISLLIPTPGNQIYASYLLFLIVIFSLLSILVIIYSIILTKLYFGGECSLKNMEAIKIYRLKVIIYLY